MLATVQRGLTRTMIDVGTLDMEIIATATPKSEQTQRLNVFRTAFQPLALRFPMYVVNVQAAPHRPGTGRRPGRRRHVAAAAVPRRRAGHVRPHRQPRQRASATPPRTSRPRSGTWQSDRINVLTIVTMVFLPISFLTGYFGMNFTWLDNQLDSFWSWLLLGVVLPIVLVVVCVALLAPAATRCPGSCGAGTASPGLGALRDAHDPVHEPPQQGHDAPRAAHAHLDEQSEPLLVRQGGPLPREETSDAGSR